MAAAYLVSSVGDTNLAIATITELNAQKYNDTIYLIPVTTTAVDRLKDVKESAQLKIISLGDIVNQKEILSAKSLGLEHLQRVSAFIANNNIQQAYVGVPSPIDEEIPLQIARNLQIPCVIAYEYLFTAPAGHRYWQHLPELAEMKNCQFAVPAKIAKDEVLTRNPKANVNIIGHLNIDSAIKPTIADVKTARKLLEIDEKSELVFVSGTTQPIQVDNQFLEALLKEVATNKYPQIQLRFGMHPGIKDVQTYIEALLTTCLKYPTVSKQLKLVLPCKHKTLLEEKLKSLAKSANQFILWSDVSGPDASKAADKICQAVPGALTTEAALKGKPSYYHDKSVNSYLGNSIFSMTLSAFFMAKSRPAVTQADLDLNDTAPKSMAKIMMTH